MQAAGLNPASFVTIQHGSTIRTTDTIADDEAERTAEVNGSGQHAQGGEGNGSPAASSVPAAEEQRATAA